MPKIQCRGGYPLQPLLATEPAEVQQAYLRARTREHRQQLDANVPPLLTEHGLRLGFDEVVYHDEFKSIPKTS